MAVNGKIANLLMGFGVGMLAALGAVILYAAMVSGAGAASAPLTDEAQASPPALKWDAAVSDGQGFSARYGYGGDQGIEVSGLGTILTSPDLALITVAVEVEDATVVEANGRASAVMTAALAAVRAKGVKDKDIQTRDFSIYPEYDYVRDTGRHVLVGHRVYNSVDVKIRDLDSVGGLIDAVVNVGGDDVRIRNIRFTVEDTESMRTRLRELAVRDAEGKAEHLAKLSGVKLGRLLYISEGSRAPIVGDFSDISLGAFVAAEAAPAPAIEGGELDVTFSVHARFAIH